MGIKQPYLSVSYHKQRSQAKKTHAVNVNMIPVIIKRELLLPFYFREKCRVRVPHRPSGVTLPLGPTAGLAASQLSDGLTSPAPPFSPLRAPAPPRGVTVRRSPTQPIPETLGAPPIAGGPAMDGGAAELREAHRLTGHGDRVWALAWNPAPGPGSGPVLASCSGDKTVRIWKRAPDGAWQCSVTNATTLLPLPRSPVPFGSELRRVCLMRAVD